MRFILLGFLLTVTACAVNKKEFVPEGFEVESTCPVVTSTTQIEIVKQWHIEPQINAKEVQLSSIPQAAHQVALFAGLNDWVKENKLDAMVGEGCEGDILKAEFNGVSAEDLKDRLAKGTLSTAMTSVALKLAVKYPKFAVYCGENREQLRRQLLAFSEVRGLLGYASHLQDDKYLESLKSALKLDPETNKAVLLSTFKATLVQDLEQIKAGFRDRNKTMARNVLDHSEHEHVALVVGGIHARGLKDLFTAAKVNCRVLKAPGYQEDPLTKKLENEF